MNHKTLNHVKYDLLMQIESQSDVHDNKEQNGKHCSYYTSLFLPSSSLVCALENLNK